MKNNLFTLTLCILLSCFTIKSNAQIQCGSDAAHRHLMQSDSAYRNHFLKLDSQVKTIIQNQGNNRLQSSVYTIPVVVHVIHLGEAIGTGTNISDAQIQGAIAGLNNYWRNLVGAGLDIQIEFCLASRDPNGNSTSGINRVNGSNVPNYSTLGISQGGCTAANEDSVKSLSRWPVLDYYNIWVVKSICNGQYGGWAYFPWGAPNDGTAIIYNAMFSTNSTLAHELGHGFFLYHTFEGDGGNVSCPVDTSCLDNGDRVCDTPPHKQSDCGATNPCTANGIWDNSRYNYMSYCGPNNNNIRFTQGQKDRMRAAAEVSPRLSLLTSLGCNPVSANDAGIETVIYPIKTTYASNCTTPDSINPIVQLKNYGTNALTSAIINYKFDNNSVSNYSWNGNLSSGSSINISLPSITVAPGIHTFLAFTSNPNGLSDGYAHNDSSDASLNCVAIQPFVLTNNGINVTCNGANNGSATITTEPKVEIKEDWEGTTDWTLVNGTQINKWYIGTATANGGSKSIYISNDNNSNAYAINSASIVHFYKDFNFPVGATNITIKFDWKAGGQLNFQDYFRLGVVPLSTIPVAGNQVTGGINGNYNLQNSFIGGTLIGLDALAGSTQRIVFSWINNASVGSQPPAAVDNIKVSYNTAGNIPYNYTWNTTPIQTTATANNLSTGNYLATVTDSKGCTAISSISITQPSAISLSTTQNNVSCNGGNNGNATVNATGGSLTKTVNIIENWEGTNLWTLVNGTVANKWFVGTATANGGIKSIYISDNSSSNTYTINSSSVVHFYKNFTFPSSATNIKIRFDWKGNGENNSSDYLKVFLVPTTTTPAAGFNTELTSGQIGATYNLQSTYTTAIITGLDTIGGKTKRLVFSWRNDGIGGIQPPVSIDNIVVSYDTLSNYTYSWNTSPIQTASTANNLSANSYLVIVTDANACTSNTSVTITQPNPVSVSITPNGSTTFCQGGSVTLTSSSAVSYFWSNGATTQSIIVSSSGNYSVTVTDGSGCSGTSLPITVTVNPLPNPIITPSGTTTFCQGGSVTLTSSSSVSYLWSNGATIQSISVSSSGNYSVTITNANGCSATSPTTTVTVNPLPTATITPNGSTTFCQGGSIILSANTASAYLWNNSATTQSITVSTAGNYTVTITDANGCTAISSPKSVAVNSLPNASITTSGSTIFCSGGSVTLNAVVAANRTYQWKKNNINISGATTSSTIVTISGTYKVTVTNTVTGCSKTTATGTIVTVNSKPIATITAAGSTHFCTGDSAVLNANTGGGLTYQWQQGNANISGATATFYSAKGTGTFKVIVTNANGCSKTSNSISVTGPPSATITTVGSLTICPPSTVTFSVPSVSGTTYQWQKNNINISGATLNSYTATDSGSYKVIITNSFSCSKISGVKKVIIVCPSPRLAQSENIISIHPNPTTGQFILEINSFSKSSSCIIEIDNSLGQSIFTNTIEINVGNNQKEINLSKFPSGIYFLNLKTEKEAFRQKIIKE